MCTLLNPSITILACVATVLAACRTTKEAIPDRFADADLNGDASLSRTEVAAYFTDTMFDAADANNDGNLTMQEWTAGSSDASRRRQFRVADANSDGNVTREEARAYARNRPMTVDFMKGADTNKDGGLSREEARAYYAAREGPVR